MYAPSEKYLDYGHTFTADQHASCPNQTEQASICLYGEIVPLGVI